MSELYIYNESTPRFILHEAKFGFRFRLWGCVFAHAPLLQEFGDMLTRIIINRIQSRDGKRICACFAYCFSVSACMSVSICISMCTRVSMHGLPTRVRSHFKVISHSPETSAS